MLAVLQETVPALLPTSAPWVLVLALLGLAVSWGAYRATVKSLKDKDTERSQETAEIREILSGFVKDLSQIRTALTGITGNNGIVGNLAEIETRLDALEHNMVNNSARLERAEEDVKDNTKRIEALREIVPKPSK